MASAPPTGDVSAGGERDDGGSAGGEFMANFDPELVHRVLLTDPADFCELSMSGAPPVSHTPTYEDFTRESGFLPSTGDGDDAGGEGRDGGEGGGMDIAEQISRTMKRAFHDMVVSAVEEESNYEPLRSLAVELHGAIRSLIPHRTDLHGRLRDEDIRTVTPDSDGGVLAMLPHLVRAADALSRLESEDRSETTRGWIGLVGGGTGSDPVASARLGAPPLGLTPAAFVVSSAAYLHHKALMCAADVADFRLATVLAPRIRAEGAEYERTRFCQRFGDFDAADTAPTTREWIRRIVRRCGEEGGAEELRRSEERRAAAVQTIGWVDEILFAGSGEGGDRNGNGGGSGAAPIAIPEVLLLDVPNLRRIRDATRTSVAGSALALHACTAAGVGDAVLRTDRLPEDVGRRRDGLVRAMAVRAVGRKERYERNVSAAVVELARTLQPSLGTAEEEALASRTTAVLRGEDPVIKLLDTRMREVFRIMMAWEPSDSSKVPLSMKTGRTLSLGTREGAGTTRTYATLFQEAAKREFEKKGFAFYAPELASASLLATKVINLVFVLYGEAFLERVFAQYLE